MFALDQSRKNSVRSDRAAVDSFAPDGAVKAPRSMGLITPLTGGACARHDLRKSDGPARGRPGGPRLAHQQRSR
jgi:hypothetical protein